MLTEVKISNNLYDMKQKIDQIERELNGFVDSPEHMPELIEVKAKRRDNFIRLTIFHNVFIF